MSSQFHTAVWIDQHEAHILHVGPDDFDEAKVRAADRRVHRHAKGGLEPHEDPHALARFFDDVAHDLADAQEILIVGPSTAKLHFLRHLHAHHPAVERRVVGVETVDHPTDRQLASYVRHHFGQKEPRLR